MVVLMFLNGFFIKLNIKVCFYLELIGRFLKYLFFCIFKKKEYVLDRLLLFFKRLFLWNYLKGIDFLN